MSSSPMSLKAPPPPQVYNDLVSIAFRKIEAGELEIYKNRGMYFFPNVDWGACRKLEEMLRIFPEGLQAAWIGGQIIGYVSFWPLSRAWGEAFRNGIVADGDLSAADIVGGGTSGVWFLRAIAVQASSVQLHRRVRDWLTHFIFSSVAVRGGEIIAQAVSRQGENYLLKTGFRPCLEFPGDLFFKRLRPVGRTIG